MTTGTLKGNGIAAEMEAWHREHNGRHDSPEWETYLRRFHDLMGDKYDELLEEHTNNGLFGMSKAGGCTRSAGLKRLGWEPEPFTGSTRMTFLIGHIIECLAIATLDMIGYPVTGSQEPTVIPGLMHSYTDGLISLPDGELVPLSVKSTGYKKSGRERRKTGYVYVRRGFPELPFEGVRRAQPTHWVQAQAEMHGFRLAGRDVNRELYVVVAKDIIKAMEGDPYLGPEGNGSLTFYTEWIDYDESFCVNQLVPTWERQLAETEAGLGGTPMFIDKGVDAFVRLTPASEEWNPNAGLTGTFNPCLYCDLLGACKEQIALDWRKQRSGVTNG